MWGSLVVKDVRLIAGEAASTRSAVPGGQAWEKIRGLMLSLGRRSGSPAFIVGGGHATTEYAYTGSGSG
jgi:hypothetical protein